MTLCDAGSTRRRIIGVAGVAVAALVPALRPDETRAFRRWCRSDPVFRIGGQTAHVRVAVRVRNRREARRLSAGPIDVVLQVPQGIEVTQHGPGDNGFGDGYEITVTEGEGVSASGDQVPIEIQVRVPMRDDHVPVRAWFIPVGEGSLIPAEGESTANDWLTLTS
jgi:hypothetical protein